MNLQVGSRSLVSLAFIFLSLGSVVYVSYEAVNYLSFFPALDQVQIKIASLAWLQGNATYGTLVAGIVVTNPTDYSGLKAVDASLGVHFTAFNKTLFQGQPLVGAVAIERAAAPHSEIVATLTFRLDQQQSSSLSSFRNTYDGHVTGDNLLTVKFSSFLDQVVGLLPVTEEQNVTLT